MFSTSFTIIFNIFLYIAFPIFLAVGFIDTAKKWNEGEDIPFEEDFEWKRPPKWVVFIYIATWQSCPGSVCPGICLSWSPGCFARAEHMFSNFDCHSTSNDELDGSSNFYIYSKLQAASWTSTGSPAAVKFWQVTNKLHKLHHKLQAVKFYTSCK